MFLTVITYSRIREPIRIGYSSLTAYRIIVYSPSKITNSKSEFPRIPLPKDEKGIRLIIRTFPRRISQRV
jgi:hypothetical protein